jgi:hypothetical protein
MPLRKSFRLVDRLLGVFLIPGVDFAPMTDQHFQMLHGALPARQSGFKGLLPNAVFGNFALSVA